MNYAECDALEMQLRLFRKRLVSLVVIPQIVMDISHSKIMMIGYYVASIIAHYHTSNMAAVFLYCTLGEPQTASLSDPDV